ncbi:MAG TPA: hypothetical protein DCZ03_09390 [Gammaproteobacteria bacterium]|nr:hypothetical protein [Gammaproteobacteria bacterium]
MNKKLLLLTGLSPLILTPTVQGATFSSPDPRTMAMGGTGVSSGDTGNAALINPALLASNRDEDDFSLLIIAGGGAQDEDELITELQDLQDDDLIEEFELAVDNYQVNPTTANAAIVQNTGNDLVESLVDLGGKPLGVGVDAGIVLGVPMFDFGFSVFGTTRLEGVGVLTIAQADVTEVQTRIDAATNGQPILTDPEFVSTGEFVGAIVTEVGVALAKEVVISGFDFAVGVAPKLVTVETFHTGASLEDAEFELDENTADDSNVNLDIGVVKDFGMGLRVGLVGRNLIEEEYETSPNVGFAPIELTIESQWQLGASWTTDLYILTADLDLVETDSAGLFDGEAQFLSVGGEFDLLDLAQVRAGYRTNLSESDQTLLTVGFGITFFGTQLDIAAYTNSDDINQEVGGALNLGVSF